MAKKFILFDFDGVIVDSFHAAFEVNQIIYEGFTEDDYRRLFEGNINDIKRHANHKRKSDVNFFTEYIPRLMKSKIFPGIIEVIKKLCEKYILIVVSSTISSPIAEYIKAHNLNQYFTEILGNDVHESKIEKIKMVFEKYHARPEDCVFVTDTLGDLREAAEAGVKPIAVSWGFNKKEVLEKGDSLAIVDKPGEIPEKIENYFNG